LVSGLPRFVPRQSTSGIVPDVDPNALQDPAFKEHTHESRDFETGAVTRSQDENAKILFERIVRYAFAEKTSTSEIAAPPCKQQAPFNPIYGSGPATQYQHTFEQR